MNESEMEVVWKSTLADLRLQMTGSTFNTWLAQTRLLSVNQDEYTVACHNDYAVDWLQNRLHDTVKRCLVATVAGPVKELTFVLDRGSGVEVTGWPEDRQIEPQVEPAFVGFEPYQANFVQVPKQFFEVVVREAPGVVVAFVAAVIDQTIGVIVNYNTGERREWWETSQPEIGRVAGIKSLASVGKAIRYARKRGYVIRGEGRADFRYRLRRIGEPIDKP